MENNKIVIVLLGPSGVGKTTLAKKFTESRREKNDVMSLSSGERLWQEGTLRPWTDDNTNAIKESCRAMISRTFEDFANSATHRILLLDCVKELEDAEYITRQAKTHDVKIYRTFFRSFANANALAESWKNRGAATLRRPKSPEVYLQQWYEKFTFVLQYYTKMNVLSINPEPVDLEEFMLAENLVEVGDRVFPVVPSPEYMKFLLVVSVQWKTIYSNLLSILRVNRFKFSIPASFAHSPRDVTWVADPKRYHVTPKARGVRCLLMKQKDQHFLINGDQQIFLCNIGELEIPNGTVLDGELLPSESFADVRPDIKPLGTSLFLACDVLAFSGQVIWTLPLSMRQKYLLRLPITTDVSAVVNSCNTMATDAKRNHEPSATTTELPVRVAVKRFHQSSPTEIKSCLNSLTDLPYQSTGMIFAPETSYNFGADHLTFEWQHKDFIHCNIREEALVSGDRPCHSSPHWFASNAGRSPLQQDSIIECRWDNESQSWELVRRISEEAYDEWHLRSDLNAQNVQSIEIHESRVMHPALTYDFDELLSSLNERINQSRIRRHTDSLTGLEVYSRSCLFEKDHPVDQLCQGFVLHPDSRTVVTMPFIPFLVEKDPRAHGKDDWVEATVKFDGTLGVAFWWREQVKVTTKESMDSDEATLAKNWIEEHCNLEEFQKGYTYVFESVLRRSAVEYPFQGLVLISVTNEEGYELPYDEMSDLRRRIGFFLVPPRITGRLSVILWYCCGSTIPLVTRPADSQRSQESIHEQVPQEVDPNSSPSSSSGALPNSTQLHEGWVIRFPDGKRKKLVKDWWKKARSIVTMIHPRLIWRFVKYDRLEEVFRDLPSNFRRDLDRMVNDLGKQFYEVLKAISLFIHDVHSLNQDLCFHSQVKATEDQSTLQGQLGRLSVLDSFQGPGDHLDGSMTHLGHLLDLLVTEFFEAIKITDEVSQEQATGEGHEWFSQPRPSGHQFRERFAFPTVKACVDIATTFHSDLKEALEDLSVADKKEVLKNFRGYMSEPQKDEELLDQLVGAALSHGPNWSASLPSSSRDSIREVARLIFKTYEEIFTIVLASNEDTAEPRLSTSSGSGERPEQSPVADKPTTSGFSNLLRLAHDVIEVCEGLPQNRRHAEQLCKVSREINISPFYTDNGQSNELRIPVLDYIKAKSSEICDPDTCVQNIIERDCGPSSKLGSLPNEILLTILTFLDGLNLVMASRVCRRLREIVASKQTFREKIEQARLKKMHETMNENVLTLGSSEDDSYPDSYS